MSEYVIQELHTYPVKSCAPADGVTEHQVTDYGLQYDREWMVTRPNGSFLTQRQYPELAVVRTEITDDSLKISAPSNGSISLSLERDPDEIAKAQPIEFFNKAGSGVAESPEAHDFFSDYLGKDVRLMRSVQPRPVNPDYARPEAASTTRFADGFPMLLASTASLEMLRDVSGRTIEMARFRPNIVIGDGELQAHPFEEDYWRELMIGDLRAFIVRACARCPIPDVDQRTGKRSPDRPVDAALRLMRTGSEPQKDKSGKFFGQNIVHKPAADISLRVGDPVDIIAYADTPNVELD